MSDLIKNIGKTSQVVLKLKKIYWIDNIKCKYKIEITILRLYGVMKKISLV